MKLSASLNEALNQQCIKEMTNHLKYSQIQSYFELLQLKNLAEFFKTESAGENDHFNLFMDHINDRVGGKVDIGEVPAPNINIIDPVSVGEIYLSAEQATTESIESLYALALEEGSFIDLPFLLKMLDEQNEEENLAQRIALNLKMAKDIVLFDATFER